MRSLILLAAFALPLPAQQPAVQNGTVSTAASSNLQAELAASRSADDAIWLAYTVPTRHPIYNGWHTTRVVHLEGINDWDGEKDSETPGPAHSADRALLLLRVSGHTVGTVRVEDPQRTLDAGGKHVTYLHAVEPSESVALLQSIAEHDTSNHLRDAAVFAISVHQSQATLPALTALAGPDHDLGLREKAAFWLSSSFGHEALPVLDRWAREDRDERFRAKLAFDLTLVHDPAAADLLIRMAHQDSATEVRKQAQFWMAQLGGKRVGGSLSDAAMNDPSEEIRKSAVFSLTQLPNSEGTPRLIDLAQTSKDPAVRKQAVFWLGQSSDPRALEYLTRLIKQ